MKHLKYLSFISKSEKLLICTVGPIEGECTKIDSEFYGTIRRLIDFYNIEWISQSEAETYAEFGAAPLVLLSDLGIIYLWLKDMPDNNGIGYYPGYVDTV